MSIDEENFFEVKKKSKKNKKGTISFDDELITKDNAQQLIEENKESIHEVVHSYNNTEYNSSIDVRKAKLQRKRKGQKKLQPVVEENEINQETNPSKKRKNKNSQQQHEGELSGGTELLNQEELDPANPKIKTTESIRAQKRKRHQHLVEEKKLKTELSSRQKCLNYLSEWKHSRSTWKFEKLKQIWLQQNMFDDMKVPENVWGTVVEYFNSAQGKIKSVIMKDALKIIESETNDDEDPDSNIKYNRARYVVQNLQE